jgi:hypothetical protein
MLTKTVPSNLFTGCKSISLNSLKYETHTTKDQLKTYRVSAITTIVAREKQNIESILKFNQNVVPAIIPNEISQQNNLFLLISIWALQCKELESISSTFVTAIIYFFTYVEEKFDLICQHIELVSRKENFFFLLSRRMLIMMIFLFDVLSFIRSGYNTNR